MTWLDVEGAFLTTTEETSSEISGDSGDNLVSGDVGSGGISNLGDEVIRFGRIETLTQDETVHIGDGFSTVFASDLATIVGCPSGIGTRAF